MNGNDMIEECQLRNQESLSTTAAQQSMLYPDHVRRSADTIARTLHILFATSETDIISGQLQYVLPKRPFRSESFRANDGNGNVFPLTALNTEAANSKFYNWNAQPPASPVWQGLPQFIVDNGGADVYILPVPNYNCQGGLMIDGYFGVDKWWNMNDDSPLEEGYDEVIIVGACIRRCMEMITVDNGYSTRLPLYQGQYSDLMRRHYRERIGRSEATRQAVPSRGKRLGSWAGWTIFSS